MKTKKIIADTMPLALKMVRQQLGDNAIIINTRSIKTGGVFGLFGKNKYEVTAYSMDKDHVSAESTFSIEQPRIPTKILLDKKNQENQQDELEKNISLYNQKPQNLYNHFSKQTNVEEKPSSELLKKPLPLENNNPIQDEVPSSSIEKQPLENQSPLLDEIQHMRKMMMNFMMNDTQANALPPELVKWVNQLKSQGANEEVLEYIVSCFVKKYEVMTSLPEEEIKKELITIVQDIIQKRIPASNAIQNSTRIINIVGPTGVGKTTSIAKLATEQILKQKRRVAMITTDVYRIAAVEQLKTYAGILNVPIEVVRSAEELEKALTTLKNYDLIYMDTTGRNYKEVKYLETVNEFLNQPIESESFLALSLTTKYEDLQVLLNRFLDSPIKKLILTKFDETTSYGSILNIAFNFPYEIAYITNGQSVPEDITSIDPALLTSYLLGEVKEDGSSS